VRITISLETQAVITQPSPARAKAGGVVPVEIAFTRGSQSVMLPASSTLEFVLKPKNTWTGGLLVYHSAFAAGAGGLYVGIANFATAELLSALGLTDNAPANDVSQIEAAAEVVWNIDGQRFRSTTFAVTVEAPLTDAIIVPPTDPTLYPTPAELQAILDAKADASAVQAVESALSGKAPLDHGHDIEDVSGLEAELESKAPSVVSGLYRLDATGGLQLFNSDTGSWHSLSVRGASGQETLEISAAIP
jgi:hypothetical protein